MNTLAAGPYELYGDLIEVSCAQGWQWVNEGKSPDRPKWGFVSETEGDSLAVQVCQNHLLSLALMKPYA